MQQVRREGQAEKISDLIIILLNSGSNSDGGQFPAPWQELVNIYLVKA
jgi:hypothetical protein